MHFVCINGWIEVTKQCSFQFSPTGHISLDNIPGICRSIQQSYSNLPLFDIVLQIYKFEVCIKLMTEPEVPSIFPAKLEGSDSLIAEGKAEAGLAY